MMKNHMVANGDEPLLSNDIGYRPLDVRLLLWASRAGGRVQRMVEGARGDRFNAIFNRELAR